MNEKEKMLGGLLYDANYEKSLQEERIKCKTLCQKYNNISPFETEKRKNYPLYFNNKSILINPVYTDYTYPSYTIYKY